MTEPEDLFLLASVGPQSTGLPFVLWFSAADHDIRISPGPNAKPGEFINVSLPQMEVIGGGELSGSHLALLRQWVALNLDVLMRYWNGDLQYTPDVLALLRPG